jgi:hypothetical protein
MSTSGVATKSCNNEKGSNETPSTNAACNNASRSLNIDKQMSQTLAQPELQFVQKSLPTDRSGVRMRMVSFMMQYPILPNSIHQKGRARV